MNNTSPFSYENELPYSSRVNVSILGQIFSSTTTSYKYLFFQSILEILRQSGFKDTISLNEIQLEMLARAWFPHNYFRLNFGSVDGLSQALDDLDLGELNENTLHGANGLNRVRDAVKSRDYLKYDFMRYVPYRILSPFFKDEIRNQSDSQRNESIVRFAYETRNQSKSFYFFSHDLRYIHFHHDWLLYFYENQIPLERFANWHWLEYMQKRNPSVPNVQSKLFPPLQRSALKSQTKFWKTVLKQEPLNCIFTGTELKEKDLSLDHFLPWTFVAHDQLWNLIPVSRSVNSSKSNNLPSLEQYFDAYSRMQSLGLNRFHKSSSEKEWNKTIEPYMTDLHLNRESILENAKLKKALETVIKPLYGLAANQGFRENWIL